MKRDRVSNMDSESTNTMSSSYSSYLPWDIIPEVLSLLPAKYLLRFRTVSKRWRDLIDSPCFIKMHLLRSANSNSHLKLIIRELDHIFTANLLNIVGEDQSIVDVTHLDNPPLNSYDCRLIGSCNGLLCLINYYDDIILWNPSTMRCQNIPKFTYRACHCKNYGFGYDAVNDDYKLVIIAQYRTHIDKYYSQVNIYSLKLDSWRTIEHVMSCEFISVNTSGIFIGDALHWTVVKKMECYEESYNIIAIDFRTEEFREVAKSPEYESSVRSCPFLQVLGGKLCFLSNYYAYLFNMLNIWVMKEYGVESSWTKLVSITDTTLVPGFFRSLRLIAYSRCDKKVLMQKGYEKLLWYDLEKKEESYVKFLPEITCHAAYVCLDTLVHLKDSINTSTSNQRRRDVQKLNRAWSIP